MTEQGLDLICRKDPVEASLIGPVTNSDCYTLQEWEVRQVCSVLEVMEEELVMGVWREQFEALPPKLKLVDPSSLQFLELDLNELPKELKYLFLGEEKTFLVIVSSTLDESQEGKLKMWLKQHKGAIA